MKRHLLVYVAGQYSSNIEENTKHAEQVMYKLIMMGYSVICPHKNTYMMQGLSQEQWYEFDFVMIKRCDAICLMDGWMYSRGARLEAQLALDNGLIILMESPSGHIQLANLGLVKYGIKSEVTA